MKTKQVLKIWGLAAALLSLAASCSKGQDATTSEPSTPTETSGEAAPVIAQLSMETTLPEHDLRMTEYVKLKKTTNGGYGVDFDLIEAEHGGKVPLSCIIRSDDPSQPVTYTTILFTRENDNILRIGGLPVTLEPGTDFTNAGGRKWYITGWLGGPVNNHEKRLYGSSSSYDPHHIAEPPSRMFGSGHEPAHRYGVTSLMFPWKEIELDNEGGIALGNARRVDMKLRGALIKTTVTNKTGSWFHMHLSEIYTNAFTLAGYYNMDGAPVEGAFLEWTPVQRSLIREDGTYLVDELIYRMTDMPAGAEFKSLVWVMPQPTPPANPQTKVFIAGNSFAGDYGKTFRHRFVTNKPVRTTTLKEGKVYSLNIDVYRPMMGLDYMAEYDLLNGTETTPGTFATTHYNRQPGSLYLNPSINILCPQGWHVPDHRHWDNAVVNPISPTTEQAYYQGAYIMPLEVKVTSDARYYIRYASVLYSVGWEHAHDKTRNNLRQAQRIRVVDNPDGGTLGAGEKMLEITSRYLGSSFTGTVDDVANMSEDWWSDPNYTVRRVLSAGHDSTTASPALSSGHYYSWGPAYTASRWYLWTADQQGGHITTTINNQGTYIRPFKSMYY